jgi:hypothetical protein
MVLTERVYEYQTHFGLAHDPTPGEWRGARKMQKAAVNVMLADASNGDKQGCNLSSRRPCEPAALAGG